MKLNASTLILTSSLALGLSACSEPSANQLDPTNKTTFEASISQSVDQAPVSSSKDLWAQYESLANQIKNTHQHESFEKLAEQAQTLTQLSTNLLPQFIENNQECKAYLSVAMNSVNVMLNLTLEQIEADYHADGKLPPMNDVKCYHAKDLLVHPATAAVIANTQTQNPESRQMIHDEIAEVLEHLQQVQQSSVR